MVFSHLVSLDCHVNVCVCDFIAISMIVLMCLLISDKLNENRYYNANGSIDSCVYVFASEL